MSSKGVIWVSREMFSNTCELKCVNIVSYIKMDIMSVPSLPIATQTSQSMAQ